MGSRHFNWNTTAYLQKTRYGGLKDIGRFLENKDTSATAAGVAQQQAMRRLPEGFIIVVESEPETTAVPMFQPWVASLTKYAIPHLSFHRSGALGVLSSGPRNARVKETDLMDRRQGRDDTTKSPSMDRSR